MSTDGQFSEVGEARTKIQCAKIGLKYIYQASNINVNQVEKPCSPANVPSKIVFVDFGLAKERNGGCYLRFYKVYAIRKECCRS
ncbi:hypothetical protein ACET3Z_011163 [Daucus carota]